MKYTCDININIPIEKAVELFDNRDNLFKWQEGLKHFNHLDGKPGEEGSTSSLVYEGRKGDLVLEERVDKRNFPEEFSFSYKSKGVYNRVINHFTEPEPGRTHWEVINFFRFGGFMAMMAPFMKSAFAANTLLNMERFKDFAEQFYAGQERT